LLAIVCFLSVARGQEKKSPIRFPKAAVTAPAETTPLTPDRLYVVDSDEPFALIEGATGVVRIIEKAGPLSVFSKFYGGGPNAEFRTFTGKHVWIVQPIGTGKVDLIAVPKAWTSAADFRRETILVAGNGPAPDPPKPDPPRPTAAKHVTFVGLDAKSATVINDTELRAWFKSNGIAVHVYAASDPLIKKLGLQAGVDAVGGPPCWVAQDGEGNIITQGKTTTSAAIKEALK